MVGFLSGSKTNLKFVSLFVILPVLWIGAGILSICFLSTLKTQKRDYLTYSSQTPFPGEINAQTVSADARVQQIKNVYQKFKCPLAGSEETIIKEADEHKIPYWMVAAVSFQESSCGKNTPEPSGVEESFNAWGYGVWGGHIKTFDNWEAGIAAVSKYFGDNFFSRGITDPCQIMKTYTPPSKGSWCEGVKYFAQMIESAVE